ncbi:acyltransferase [Priestia megaterium]|uniref:acyltransferase n=1 Tax=Priestia megaterium TaxID=1404 RepID=UPI001141095C|nr:acyltransferase [Priestia megaterium]
MNKYIFYFILFIVNKILCGNRFFKVKNFLLRSIGLRIGIGTKIVGPISIRKINKIQIGEECWIGKNFTVDGNGNVVIGDRCDLAPNVLINSGGHKIGEKSRRAGAGLTLDTKIESGTWIGTNVIIINGAKIGPSSIVAAGAVVTQDIQRDTLVAGVPAKTKKKLD